MESPSSTGDTHKIAVRSSMIESFRACGLSGLRIDKEELKQKLTMPQYLRLAMRECIRSQDLSAGESHFSSGKGGNDNVEPPEAPLVVFINPRSGGRHGPVIKERIQYLISEEQVIYFFFSQFNFYFYLVFKTAASRLVLFFYFLFIVMCLT